jgi:hypothetical protein
MYAIAHGAEAVCSSLASLERLLNTTEKDE